MPPACAPDGPRLVSPLEVLGELTKALRRNRLGLEAAVIPTLNA